MSLKGLGSFQSCEATIKWLDGYLGVKVTTSNCKPYLKGNLAYSNVKCCNPNGKAYV